MRCAGWMLLVPLLALSATACSDRSYAGRAERHLGAVTQAAVETLRSVEDGSGVQAALDRYAQAIREAEAFLAAQTGYAQRASYQKFRSLLGHHKEFHSAVDQGGGPRTGDGSLEGSNDGHGRERAKPEWVQAMNQLLRESGELRGLLRRGE